MKLKSTTLKLLKTMDPNDVQNEKSCGQLTLELTYKPFKEEDMQKEGTEGTDMLEKAPDGTPAVQLVVACFMLLFMKVKITRGSTLQTHVQKNFPKARRRKQKVIKKNRDPQWEYEFEFVCEEPLVNDNHVEVLSKAPKKGLIHAKRRRKDVHWGAADVFFRMHTWLLTCRYLIPFSPGFWAQLPIWLFFQGRAPQGIRLYFLPRGMATRENNCSRHNHRKDCIYWTLEWKFNSTDVLTDHELGGRSGQTEVCASLCFNNFLNPVISSLKKR